MPVVPSARVVPRTTAATISAVSQVIHVPAEAATAFLWSAVGIAVITGLLQGLVTALALMTESNNQWTFRFRIARAEHLWWSVVTGLLLISLILDILSFSAGNTSDSVAILLLASTTFLAIVRYLLPSWRSRHYINNRLLAWTGPSRTGIRRHQQLNFVTKEDWEMGARIAWSKGARPTPSDEWGWHLWHVRGISLDPTDIINTVAKHKVTTNTMIRGRNNYIYEDGYPSNAGENASAEARELVSSQVSLHWGAKQGFLPRVSRAVNAMPIQLLKSQPFTMDGYAGEGLCIAMGILGRNKGVKPGRLVFNWNRTVGENLEVNSAWRPRPSKTLRSYYTKAMREMFGGLGEAYVHAATELALIIADVEPQWLTEWLAAHCEQQSLEKNALLVDLRATEEELRASYEASYVSMILSLNNMKYLTKPIRPDIICTGLLLCARRCQRPIWWSDENVNGPRHDEWESLDREWYVTAAKLLGLQEYPTRFQDGLWPGSSNSGAETITESAVVPVVLSPGMSSVQPEGESIELADL